ncbi:MAG: GEVED domain-containing protein [Crocinitomicaceae bacterium]
MKVILICLVFFVFFLPANAQYCLNIGPSSTADSNVESVNLIGDGNSISQNGCPGISGLEDHTSLMATLTAGNNYTLNVQFGTCGGNYASNGQAWIDFNRNNIFEPNETIGTWNGTPPVSLSAFNFTPPINSINGTTRMRIIQREGGSLPIDPCASFTWGSASDFSIEITGGIDCSGFVGNTEDDPINVTSVPYSNTIDNSYCYFNNSAAYPSPDVFFLLRVANSAHSVSVSLCGSTFDTFLSVFDKDGNTITYNDDSDLCGNQSEVAFNVNNRDSILIVVEGWGNEQGEFDINILGEFLSIDNVDANHYSLFPNPANDFFNLDGVPSQQIKIFNVIGNLVQTTNYVTENPVKIDQLTPGYYLVHFSIDGINYTNSLIIE